MTKEANAMVHDFTRVCELESGMGSQKDVLPPGGGPTVKLRPDVFAIDALSSARTSKPLAVY